ncbi:MAG: Type 1 glutamine amidotransferase-like domain-containing protein [Mycobacteriales bacterium]
MSGPVALVGSGEYLTVMTETEGLLLQGRPPRYVQLPTAAAPEGDESLARWVALGRQQAARLGVEAVPLVVRDRDDADNEDLASLVDGAGLVYLSGGNPPYLAATLRGTRVWEAIRRAWEGGAALAGCSAGAMALTSWVPDIRQPLAEPQPGLGVVGHLQVIPHFDRFVEWMPDLVGHYLGRLPDGVTLLGVDEDTALVGTDGTWTVHGRQSVWVLTHEGRTRYGAGDVVPV